MRIAAITKFKQGDLWEALQKAGWNQAELSTRAGVHKTTIYKITSMQARPTAKVAAKIQEAFGQAGIYLDILATWPDGFALRGRGAGFTQIKDIEEDALLEYQRRQILELDQPERLYGEDDLEEVEKAMDSLSEVEQGVLKSVYFDGNTLRTTGKAIGLSVERARQIRNTACHKLRRKLELAEFSE